MTEEILVTREEGIATVTLNRPAKLNAMTKAMWRDLGGAMIELGVGHDQAQAVDGRAEPAGLPADPDVGQGGDLQSAAHADPVNHCHHGCRQAFRLSMVRLMTWP